MAAMTFFILVPFPIAFASLHKPVATWIGSLAILFAIQMGLAIDAWRIARNAPLRTKSRGRVVALCTAVLLLAGFASLLSSDLTLQLIAEPFRNPSGGMWPTLWIGDHFYADVWSMRDRAPTRGEIIVLKVARDGGNTYPTDERPDLTTEVFVKRIVGIPGDLVKIEDAMLWINGERATGPVLDTKFERPDGGSLPMRKEQIGERSYFVLDEPDRKQEPVLYRVEPDRYFVAGDNRDNSVDSRSFGTIRRDSIIGPVTKIYWSWDYVGPTYGFLSPWQWKKLWDGPIRWDRIGLKP